MNSILNIGKTGLHGIQNKMDSIADEINNVSTYGYKRKNVSFSELLTNEIHENDVKISADANNRLINMGSKASVTGVNFEQGPIVSSSEDFDMAIEGQGFFGLVDGEGNLSLTRNGSFSLNPDGRLTNIDGYYLDINYNIQAENWMDGNIQIRDDGQIFQDTDNGQLNLGRIVLYNPDVLDSLTSLGEGRYLPKDNVGLNNSTNNPDDFGKIRQHALETSNVDLTKSLTEMIISQRSYSLNLRLVQTTDDIMLTINNIK